MSNLELELLKMRKAPDLPSIDGARTQRNREQPSPALLFPKHILDLKNIRNIKISENNKGFDLEEPTEVITRMSQVQKEALRSLRKAKKLDEKKKLLSYNKLRGKTLLLDEKYGGGAAEKTRPCGGKREKGNLNADDKPRKLIGGSRQDVSYLKEEILKLEHVDSPKMGESPSFRHIKELSIDTEHEIQFKFL